MMPSGRTFFEKREGSSSRLEVAPSESRIASRDFPYLAVCILSLTQGLNAFTRTSLFPYVGFMVKHLLSLSTDDVGFYVGFVASALTLGRLLTVYFWGHAADVVGRKPVITIGTLTIAVLSVAFGFSPTFAWAIGLRFLLGAMVGIVPAVRAAIREVCGTEHVVRGMAYLGGATGVGSLLGATVGGLLAQPVDYYPSAFSSTGVFARYPYLLPNLFGACWALLLLPFLIVYLPETKCFNEQHVELEQICEGESDDAHEKSPDAPDSPDESLVVRRQSEEKVPEDASFNGSMGDNSGGISGDDVVGHEDSTPERFDRAPRLWKIDGLLATPHVKVILVLGFALQMVMLGFQEVFPLWALSSNGAGGLEWNTIQIGKVAGVTSFFIVIAQLVFFPAVIKEIGIATWSRAGCLLAVVASFIIPHAKVLSWNEASLFAVLATSNTLVKFGEDTVMIALTVGVTSIVPGHQRGKLSGLYTTAESLGRCLGPVTYAIIFAWSISASAPVWVDHRFVFYLCAVIMLGVTTLSWSTLTSENLMEPTAQETKGGSRAANSASKTKQREVEFVSSPRANRREANMV